MSLQSGKLTVTTSPTLVTTGKTGASWVQLHAPTGGNTVYIGDATVSTTTGFELVKGTVVQIWLAETDQLYAIVGSSTEVLYWLHTGGR